MRVGGVGESSVELIDHVPVVLEVVIRFPGVLLRAESFPTDQILAPLSACPAVENFFYFPFVVVVNGDRVGWVGLAAFNQIRLTSSKQ